MHGDIVRDPRVEGRIANLVSIGGNVVLAVAQLLIGVHFKSQALIAEGINHSGDFIHTMIAWIGFRIAEKPADEDHPYGHGNAESVAGILIGLVLCFSGIYILYRGINAIVEGVVIEASWPVLITAVATIFIKEALARYCFRVGNFLNSPTIIAVAQDHRSDVFTAAGAVIGIIGAKLGYPIFDPIAAIFIGVYIVGFLSFPVLRSNFDVLMDAAPRTDLADRIRNRYNSDREVKKIDSVRIHPLGPYYEIDLEISIDGDLKVREGHSIAHRVRDEILASEVHVREVKIHVNPSPE